MASWTERSFDLVAEITKQLITLSTAVIAVSVTFLTDVANQTGLGARWLLGVSWVAFLLAIIFGILTLMGLAGVQRDAGKDEADLPTIDESNLRILGMCELGAFGLGMLLLLAAGIALF